MQITKHFKVCSDVLKKNILAENIFLSLLFWGVQLASKKHMETTGGEIGAIPMG